MPCHETITQLKIVTKEPYNLQQMFLVSDFINSGRKYSAAQNISCGPINEHVVHE